MPQPFRVLKGLPRHLVVNGDVFEAASAEEAQRYADDMNAAGGAAQYAEQAFARDPSLRDRIAPHVQ